MGSIRSLKNKLYSDETPIQRTTISDRCRAGEVNYTEDQLVFNSIEDIVAFCNQVGNQVSNQANEIITEQVHAKVKNILSVATSWISREDIFNKIDLSNQSKNRKKYIDPLIDLAWIEMKYPESKTNPAQAYKITETGKKVLNLISKQ